MRTLMRVVMSRELVATAILGTIAGLFLSGAWKPSVPITAVLLLFLWLDEIYEARMLRILRRVNKAAREARMLAMRRDGMVRECCGTPPGTGHLGTCRYSAASTGEFRP